MNAQDFSKMTAENINLHCFLGISFFLTIVSVQGYLQDHHNGGGCPPHQGRWRLPPKALLSPKEVVTMISIDTVIAVITLVITAVGFGLQLASYINTKNNRPSDKL